MTNVEINNEIVLLRKSVRQARICVINKLIRQAKTLHNKQGTEKQVEKNRKRADKQLKEVYAIRVIKDDEISKFGIANFDRLQTIIQDPATNDRTRIIVKVVKFKALYVRIAEFREKFPNCENLFATKKKKKVLTKLRASTSTDTEWEPTSKIKTADVNSALTLREPVRKSPRTCKQQKSETRDAYESDEDCQLEEQNEQNKQNKKSDRNTTNLKKMQVTPNSVKCNVPKTVKVISNQATVKRLTEILQETSKSGLEMMNMENPGCSRTEDTPGPSRQVSEMSRIPDDFFLNPHENVEVTKTFDSWERNNADLSETSSTLGMQRLKKQVILSDTSMNAGRRKANVVKLKSNDRDWKQDAARGTKTRKTIAKPKKKSSRQNVENASVEDNGNLHPSWAARKKQQEIMKQGFQGKKIVFDED